MEPILFLVHRIPFPPNKGDKIRAYHLLRYLAARYRVFLGTFVDHPDDRAYIPDVSKLVEQCHVATLHPTFARMRSLTGLLSGEALSLPYYRDAGLRRWVESTVRAQGIGKAVIFSSVMAQYLQPIPGLRVVADFCDVDSAKWTEYATRHRWPASWIYRREGKALLAFERTAAASAHACVLVTAAEAELFARLAPECAPRVRAIGNGVDAERFAPDPSLQSPFPAGEAAIVFTGAMDYWPNIDAVTWFAREVLPAVVAQRPDVRFYIVGMNPTPAVSALASDPHVRVTGKVPDVRPYLQHATVVVAPLRVARGVQNKVLEAMAMEQTVVATASCVAPLSEKARRAVVTADDAAGIAARVLDRLSRVGAAQGRRARQAVLEDYSWEANLGALDELLESPAGAQVEPKSIPARAAEIGAGWVGGDLPT